MKGQFPCTLFGALDYHGECQHRSRIGGDFFDFIPLMGGRLFAAIGDFSAYGVGASVIASGLRSFMGRLVRDEGRTELDSVTQDLNSTIWGLSDGYATLFCSHFDPIEQQLIYVSAGHEPALLIRNNGRIRRLEAAGAPLGLSRRSTWRPRRVDLDPGDVLVAFTEGITDSVDAEGGELRDSGLLEVMRFHREAPASDLVRWILEAVDHFDRSGKAQDRTVMVIRYLGAATADIGEHSMELALSAA
jgi:sigma-B regulation protein RsbU (phosphoserine phosphatase)